jgi:hypothetical protein
MKTDQLDPQLLEIFSAAANLYNREAMQVQSPPNPSASVNAMFFLANQAVLFADAALFILRDEAQPLIPVAALLRTCLEAQARANHIVALVGDQRETRAKEFIGFMKVGEDYFETMLGQTNKDFPPDLSICSDKARPILEALKPHWEAIKISDLKKLKKQQKDLNKNWSYGEVIGRAKFSDANWQKRTEAQTLQPSLYLAYIQACSFVHCDPASLKFQTSLTRLDIAFTAVVAEVIALLSLFDALGKSKDAELLRIKTALITYQKTLVDKRLGL